MPRRAAEHQAKRPLTKRRRAGKVAEVQAPYLAEDLAVSDTAVTTLSSKHQVTLPVALVREMELEPGDKLTVQLREGRIVLTRQPRTPEEWVRRFSGALKDVYGESAEEMDEYVRRERESWESEPDRENS